MITRTEKEILDLLKEGLSIKQISNRRKTTVRATQKIVRRLREYGLVAGSSYKGFRIQATTPPIKKNTIRLHGQEFNIKIKFKGYSYKPNKSYIIDDNRIKLYNNSLEVYSKQSFYGDSAYESHLKSVSYFRLFFLKLQDRFGILLKNVKLVNAHYSEIKNELAKDSNRNKRKINIKGIRDNKIWLKADYSLKEDELETLHPKTSLNDMDNVISPFFNDLRENNPPLPSEAYKLICAVANNQQMFNENLVKHMKVLDDMSKTLKKIRDSFK